MIPRYKFEKMRAKFKGLVPLVTISSDRVAKVKKSRTCSDDAVGHVQKAAEKTTSVVRKLRLNLCIMPMSASDSATVSPVPCHHSHGLFFLAKVQVVFVLIIVFVASDFSRVSRAERVVRDPSIFSMSLWLRGSGLGSPIRPS